MAQWRCEAALILATFPVSTMRMRIFGLLATALLAGACSSLQERSTLPVPAAAVPTPRAAAVVRADTPFDRASLYKLLVAEFALERNRPKVAVHYYHQLLQRTKDPAIAWRTAEIAGALGLHGLEMEALRHRLDAVPDDGIAHLAVARILLQTGRPETARPHLIAAIALHVRIRYQQLALAVSNRLAADRRAALRVLESLPIDVRDAQAYPEWLQARALLLEHLGEPHRALSLLQEAARAAAPHNSAPALAEVKLLERLQRPLAARQRLEDELAAYPDSRLLRWHYALQLSVQEPETAILQLERLMQEHPDDYRALFSLALLNWEIGNLDMAQQQFQRLLAVGFQPDTVHFYLGRLAHLQDDAERATEHYLAVQSGPQLPVAARYLGMLLLHADRVDEMQVLFTRHRVYNQRQTLVFYLLEAELLIDSGRWQRGLQLLRQALRYHPGNQELRYLYALIDIELGNFSAAERELRALLQSSAGEPRLLNALGYTLADRTTRYEEAYELIHQAFAKRPDDPAILDSMGWVHYRMGDLKTALDYLQRAMSLQPDHEIAAHLGEVLWMLGRTEQAHRVWEDAMRNKPDSTVLRDTVERIDQLTGW